MDFFLADKEGRPQLSGNGTL